MPSVIRKESQLAIYRNEKPSPGLPALVRPYDREYAEFIGAEYKADLANWFSTSERFEVHPEEEEKFIEIVWPYPVLTLGELDSFQENLKEGIEIPDSCYEVRKKIVKNKDGSERGEFKKFAYFVPPSEGSHANKTGAGKPIIGLPEFLYTGDRGEIYIGFMGDTEVSHEWNQWLKANGLSENLSHEPVSIGDSREGLKDRSEQIDLLYEYSLFLEKNGYLDTDWRSEPPFAIDEFLSRK